MELPLTPVDFLRRARKLHPGREAVVDGAVRLNYAEFGARCDRWAVALRGLGIGPGDRVATIAANSSSHLEQFYAIPLLGAVIVPLNYRLTGDDFAYLVGHSGATVVCVDGEHLEAVDKVREHMPDVRHFVALEGARPGWLAYEELLLSLIHI